MFGALATGRTRVSGLLEAQDILNTVNVLRALGCLIDKVGDTWVILGRGVGDSRRQPAISTSATPAPAPG